MGKPATHILSTTRCEACHTPVAFNPAVNFDHAEARGSCSTCHNNVQAQGKGPTHVATDLECDACHSTIGWAGALFNHAGITSGCAACHNGIGATGMPGNHVPTNAAACESCHAPANYITFRMTNASATAPPGMVHSNVSAAACSTCHETGLSFVGSPATVLRPQYLVPGNASSGAHVPSGECSTCHFSTSSFAGAQNYPVDHIPIPGGSSATCASCHSNAGDFSTVINNLMNHQVVGISSGCAACHATGLSFAGNWTNTPLPLTPPGNHIPTGTAACESCHTPVDFLNKFKIANAVPPMNHSVVSTIPCASCHAAGLTFVGATPVLVAPANHVPIGSAGCDACHFATDFSNKFQIQNSSTAAAPGMVHSAVASAACSSCHGPNLSWVGTNPKTVVTVSTPIPAHVPYDGADCKSCHSPTVFTAFTMTNATATAPPGMVHSLVTATACSACHEAGVASPGVPPTVLRPAYLVPGNPGSGSHVAAGECSTCHFNTTSFLGASNLPTNHIPLPAADGSPATCTLCHASTDYSISAMNHVNITSNCAQCHAAGLSFAGVWTTTPLKAPPTNHIPFGTAACESCHAASVFTNFKITNTSTSAAPGMVHTAVSLTSCAACHAAGVGSKFVAPVKEIPAIGSSGGHVQIAGADCQSCHAPTAFNTFSIANATATGPPGMVHSLVSAVACSACHEKGLTFLGAPVTVTRPQYLVPGNAASGPHVATGECSTCHFNTTSFLGATNLPANHIPLPAGDGSPPNCTLCHSNSGDFSVFSMNHVNITSNCAQCHAAGLSFAGVWSTTPLKAPPSNHIPFGTARCESCHAPAVFTTFKITNLSTNAAPGMVHAAVGTMSCAACHAAGVGSKFVAPVKEIPAIGSPGGHVQIAGADCKSCHSPTAFTSFSITNASTTAAPGMVHSLVTSVVCSTCHEAGLTFLGSPATVVRPQYLVPGNSSSGAHVTTGECSTCHFSTSSFLGAQNLPANHIPLPAADNNSCVLCHTTGDFTVYVMNHVNITNNCAKCHATGLSFAGVWTKPLVSPPTGPTGHVPFGTITCESCHSATVFTTFSGTVMKHAAARANACDSCHEYGMKWKTNTGVRLWVRDGPGHHAGQDCGGSGCHSTRDKTAARPAAPVRATLKAVSKATSAGSAAPGVVSLSRPGGFSHQRLMGATCVSCHGAGSSDRKPADHMASTETCQSCHTTTAWLPVARVDHTQVKGSCVSCHNKSVARGKSNNHIASNNNCETCHTTNAWTPARFDHLTVAAHSCRSCHDAVHASGLPINHVPTSQQCDSCHGTLSWKPAKLDHATLTSGCAACHNNTIATGKISTHLSTQRDCSSCHRYPDWSVITFRHSAAAYPGDHKATLTCVACHTGNSEQVPYASPADAGTCGGCHAKDFRPDAHPKTVSGLRYSAAELHNCSGACHIYSDATLGTVVKSLRGLHHRVSDAAFKH